MTKKRGLGSWVRRHKFWAVFLGLIIFYALLWSAQAAVERYNYYRVGNLLENMLVTLPDGEKSDRKIETVNSCGRGSAKFSAGPLRCSVEKKATYQLSEFKDPDQIYSEIDKHINSRNYAKTDGTVILPIELDRLSPDEVRNEMLAIILPDFELSKFKSFSCGLDFNIEKGAVSIRALCARDARMEFFRVN